MSYCTAYIFNVRIFNEFTRYKDKNQYTLRKYKCKECEKNVNTVKKNDI